MCVQNISIFVSKIGLFGHYLEIASLDFADFAYYIRQEWYLTDLGGSSPQKKYLRLLWTIKACLQIIFGPTDFGGWSYRFTAVNYLIRTNFRADKFSRTSSARKLEIFARIYFRAPFTKIRNSVLIFAQFRANCWLKELFCIAFFKIWSLKIFARINFRASATNLQKFGTNFRAISRKSRFCAKMRENLSARKLVRISH